MLHLCTIIVLSCLTSIKSDIIETHHHIVHEPVLTKIGTITHDVPSSAVSHQSFTQIHSKTVETPIIQPGIKTTIHHTSPTLIQHDVEPVETVEHVEAEAATKNTASANMKIVELNKPIVKSAPLVQTYSSSLSNGIVHSIPLFKTIIPASSSSSSSSYTYIHHH